jgi:hypothetical protein
MAAEAARPAKATVRRKQKAESRNWPFAIGYLQSAGKATQSHINATSKPPQSVLIAN